VEPGKVLEYLEDLAIKLGVEIVYGKLGGEEFFVGGGLCKVKGVYKIFLDRSEPTEKRIQILAKALCSFHREDVYVRPFIREILEKAQRTSG